MEIYKLPQLKNKNFLESQIRQFTTVKNIIDNIEEESINKFNQVEVIKSTNLLEKRKQNYSRKNTRLFSVKHYQYKNNPKIIHKIENKLIKNKLKRNIEPKLIYFHEKSLGGDIFSPLNEKYKLLISSIDYNKRCFRNLRNKDFDNIFNDNSNIHKEYIKKLSLEQSIPKKITKRNNNKYKDIKNKNNSYRNSTVSYNKSINNIFLNRIKNINNNNIKDLIKSKKINKNNFNYTLYNNKENNSIKKVNSKPNIKYINLFNADKDYEKFVSLLKKQSDKNIKLLNDVKKQETMSKDNLLVSIARLKGYKSKKSIYC